MGHSRSKGKGSVVTQKLNASAKPNWVEETAVKSMLLEDKASPLPARDGLSAVDDTVNEIYNSKELSPKLQALPHIAQLPQEILEQIFSDVAHCPSSQSTLCASSLVSRSWYHASITLLYHSPRISGKNYDLFTRTVCPSINAHIKSNGLSEMVKTLDMSSLVHNGSKSLTARLLGRVKGHLEVFIAPQASFAINCLAALSRCHKLIYLDLSLVSESLAMADLFHSISTLHDLESFHFPRSSSNDHRTTALFNSWPPKLRKLQIAGGIRDESILYFSTIPYTLTHLVIGDCPNLSWAFVNPLLTALGPHLQYLRIDPNLPKLSWLSLNGIIEALPVLRHLNIAIGYIYEVFFREGRIFKLDNYHCLEFLQLSCHHSTTSQDSQEITSDDIWSAVVDGPLKNLRRIRVSRRLGWTQDEEGRRAVKELSALLEALAREDRGESSSDEDVDAGVWVLD